MIPFNSDPNLPIADRIEETGGIFVSYSPSDENTAENRKRKQQFVDQSNRLVEKRNSQYNDLANPQSVILSKQATVEA